MKRTVLTGVTALAVLALSACGTADPFADPQENTGTHTVVIGTANFPESEIIGQIWAEALRQKGFDTEVSSGIGSREVYLGALEEGSVTLVPEYSGNLAQFYGSDPTASLGDALPDGLEAGELSPAESKDAYRVTRVLAEAESLATIGDLDKLDAITIAAPPEFAERPYGPAGLTEVYGIAPDKISVTPISDGGGPLTVQSLVAGAANVGNIFTTSPALLNNGEEADLVTLEDPENLIPPQHIVPVFASGSLPDGALEVINSVNAQLTTEDLVEMNLRNVGPERAEPGTIARDFVASL